MDVAGRDQIQGWKEIALYLGRDERTAKRWEKQRGLPVRRIPGSGRANVYIMVAELDRWLAAGAGERLQAEKAGESAAESVALVAEPVRFAKAGERETWASGTLGGAQVESVERSRESSAAEACGAMLGARVVGAASPPWTRTTLTIVLVGAGALLAAGLVYLGTAHALRPKPGRASATAPAATPRGGSEVRPTLTSISCIFRRSISASYARRRRWRGREGLLSR